MHEKGLLKNKRILLIDPDEKKENDKTFCFWAEESDDIYKEYASIISNSWKQIQINNFSPTEIAPLCYYHINSLDLYQLAREIIKMYDVNHIKESVLNIYKSGDKLYTESEGAIYQSTHVFDGRPPNYNLALKSEYNISQSFIGYKIKLEEGEFNDEVYHMMDFRVDQSIATQFIYILPYSKSEALVELTRFGKQLLDETTAKEVLQKFISKNYGDFHVVDQEKGVIPMSSTLPKIKSVKNWINIGTRAGNVKPSTGYAFKNMYAHSKNICNSIDLNPKKSSANRRFLFYDQLLLIILTIWPNKGKPIFERLFKAKSANFVLQFLDEKTSFSQELSMFSKLQIGVFLKALLYWLYWKYKGLIFPILMSLYVLFSFVFEPSASTPLNTFQFGLLILGLLVIGIPHGALDHLTGFISKKKKISLKFIVIYLLLMVPVFFLWILFPKMGLFFFLIYSAWHFGQTDMKHWNIRSKSIGFLWGVILLSFLLLTHIEQLNIVLNALNINSITSFNGINFICYFIIAVGFILSVILKKIEWFIILTFLFFSQYINLIFAFGIYFIFHHSRIGWKHLKRSLSISNFRMYFLALPFNIGAIVLFLLFFNNFQLSLNQNIAYFFIFLSCVSFPHVISMAVFYKNNK